MHVLSNVISDIYNLIGNDSNKKLTPANLGLEQEAFGRFLDIKLDSKEEADDSRRGRVPWQLSKSEKESLDKEAEAYCNSNGNRGAISMDIGINESPNRCRHHFRAGETITLDSHKSGTTVSNLFQYNNCPHVASLG